jgi:small subunit ribosomal protein S9
MKVIQSEGSRKRSVARAVITEGKGKITINGQLIDNLNDSVAALRIKEPVVLAGNIVKKLNIDVKIRGGGVFGQADAARLAIARGLVQHDKKLKSVFTEYDRLLLVADVRRKEVCKPNDSKARAKRQKSYR